MSETIFPEVAPPTYVTPEPPATAPILKFEEWKQTEAEGLENEREQKQNYFDYYRVEKFKRNELDAGVEADIRQLYFQGLGAPTDLSEEERSQIGLQSTAYRPSSDQQLELIKGGYGAKEIQPFLDLPEQDQKKRFSDAKELLVRRGQLSFASLNKEGRSFVQAGNYDKLDPNDISFAKQEALTSLESGALNPTDLWQVSHGLKKGIGERSLFQSELDQDILGKLQDIITEEDSSKDAFTPLTDALDEVITTKDEKSFFTQLTGDDPMDISQVLVEEDPTGIRSVQNTLLRLFNEDKGITTNPAFERVSDSDKYTRDRIITLVQELAVRHANESNQFGYTDDPKNFKANIRRSKLGVPMADPRLMMQRDDFSTALLQHEGLSDIEKDLLKRQRNFYMLSRAKRFDRILSDFSATSDKWLTLKTSDPEAFKNNPVEVLDEFLSDEDNYKSFKNKALGVGSSVKDALFGLVASVGALAGNQNAVDYLNNYQIEQQERAELANLFGDEMGTTYQVLSTATPMIADIGVTMLLTATTAYGGAAYVAAKTVAKKGAREVAEKAAKGAVAPMTFGKVFSKEFTNNLGKVGYQLPALTTSVATRVFGNSYATIYSALPDDPNLSAEENHQYKRDRALGYGARAAVGAGLITASFSAFGFGGLESVFLRRGTFRQLKSVHDKFAGNLNARYGGMSSDQFRKLLTESSKRVNKEILSGLKGKGFIPLTLTRAAEEAVEEGVQEIFIGLMEEAGHKQDVPLIDLLHRGLNAAKVGGILGGSVSAVRSGIQALTGKDTFIGDASLFEAEQARLLSEDRKLVSRLEAVGAPDSAKALQEILLSTPARTGTGKADGTTSVDTKSPTESRGVDTDLSKKETEAADEVANLEEEVAKNEQLVQNAKTELEEEETGIPVRSEEGVTTPSLVQTDKDKIAEKKKNLEAAQENLDKSKAALAEAKNNEEVAYEVAKPINDEGDFLYTNNILDKVVPSKALTETSGLSTVLDQWQVKNREALVAHGISIKPVESIKDDQGNFGMARVVANEDLSITIEVSIPTFAGNLTGSSDPYDSFQSVMGHEIIHALEFVHLRREYLALSDKERSRQTFGQYLVSRKKEIYNSIEGSEEITEDIRRQVVSLYYQIPIQDVVLPGEKKYTASIEHEKALSSPVYARFTKKIKADLKKVRQSKPFFVSWEASDFELNWETENKRIGERIDGNNIGIYRYETTFEGDTNPTKYKIERVSTRDANGKTVRYWQLSTTKKEVVVQTGLAKTRDVIEPGVDTKESFFDEKSTNARNEAEKRIRERLKLPPKDKTRGRATGKKGHMVDFNAMVVVSPFNYAFKSEPPYFSLQVRQLERGSPTVRTTEPVEGDPLPVTDSTTTQRQTFDSKQQAEQAANQAIDKFVDKLKQEAEANNTEFGPEQEAEVREKFKVKVEEKKPQLNEELILAEAVRMIVEARRKGDPMPLSEEKLMSNSKFPPFLQNILDLLKNYAKKIAATISNVPKQLNELIGSVESILADYNAKVISEIELTATEMPRSAETMYFARLIKEASARLFGAKAKVRLTKVNADKYQFTGEFDDVTIERVPYANQLDLGTTVRVLNPEQDKWIVKQAGKNLKMPMLNNEGYTGSEVLAIFDSPNQASIWFTTQDKSGVPRLSFKKVQSEENEEEYVSNAGIINIVKDGTKFKLFVDGELYGSTTNTDLNTFDSVEAAKEVAQTEWNNLFTEISQPKNAAEATRAYQARTRNRIKTEATYATEEVANQRFYRENNVEVDETNQDPDFPEDTFNEGFRKESKWLKEAPDQAGTDYVNKLLSKLAGTGIVFGQIEYTPFSDTNKKPTVQTSGIIRHGNEIIVSVDLGNGISLPFYIFNGQHDNPDGLFQVGKWYPFLGISETGGWMSKLDGFNASKGFGIDEVTRVQRELNVSLSPSTIDASQIPLAKFTEGNEKQEAGFMTHVSWINDNINVELQAPKKKTTDFEDSAKDKEAIAEAIKERESATPEPVAPEPVAPEPVATEPVPTEADLKKIKKELEKIEKEKNQVTKRLKQDQQRLAADLLDALKAEPELKVNRKNKWDTDILDSKSGTFIAFKNRKITDASLKKLGYIFSDLEIETAGPQRLAIQKVMGSFEPLFKKSIEEYVSELDVLINKENELTDVQIRMERQRRDAESATEPEPKPIIISKEGVKDPLDYVYKDVGTKFEYHRLGIIRKKINELKAYLKKTEQEDFDDIKPLVKANVKQRIAAKLNQITKQFEFFGDRDSARRAVTNFTEVESLIEEYTKLGKRRLLADQEDVFNKMVDLASKLELKEVKPPVTESTPKKVEIPPKEEIVSVTKEQTSSKETIFVARVGDQVAGEFKSKAEADAKVEEAYQTATEPDVIPDQEVYKLTPPTRKKPVKVKGFGENMQWYNEEVGGWFTPRPEWMRAWSAQMKDPTVATDETVAEETTTQASTTPKVTVMGVDAYANSVQDGSVVEDQEEGTFTYEGRKYKGPFFYPKSRDPALVEGVEVTETPSAPAAMLPERFYELGAGDNNANLSQDQERVAQLANTAKTSALQFTNAVVNDNDPNVDNGAVWFEVQEKETVVHVNPYGIHQITDGLAPQEAIDLVNAEVVSAMARASAMRVLSSSDLDAAVAVTTEVQLDTYIDDVFSDEAQREEVRQALNDPETRTLTARTIIEGHIVNYAQRTLTGSSITQDRHFARSNPTFKSVVWNFFKKVLTRLYQGQRLNRDNATIALMVNRVANELRVIKGGVRAERTVVFNPDEPDTGGQALIEQYQKDYETGEVSAPAAILPPSPGDAPTVPDQKSPEQIVDNMDFGPVITLLELPVAAVGQYTKPKYGFFAGERDPRLQALYLQHKGYKSFIEEAFGQFHKEYEAAVKSVFPEEVSKDQMELLKKAIGNAAGVETEEFHVRKEEIIDQYEEDQRDLSDENLSKEDYQTRLDELEAEYKERIEIAKADVATSIKEDQQIALEEIRSIPNGDTLALILENFRSKIDQMSAKFAEMQGIRSPDFKAHLTNQLGIYITRSYKIFQDEGWISNVLQPKSDYFSQIRQEGIDGLRANYIPLMVNRRVEEIDRNPAKFEQYSDWTNLTTREKTEAVSNDSNFMSKIESDLSQLTDQSILEDFMYYYQTELNNPVSNDAIYLDKNRSVDSLKQKKYLPEYIRKLLGEDELPQFNLINTFVNVGNILNNHNFFQNIIATGRMGDLISDKWFLTSEELSTLSPDEQRTWIRVDDPKNGIQIGGVQSSIPEKNRSGRDQLNPFTNFIDTDNKRKKLFAKKETIDGINTLRSQAADKNHLSLAKKMEESINGVARTITGYAMAGKTLGNVGFYIRNIVSNLLFFGPAQGTFVNPFRIFNQVKTSRSLYTPDSIEEYRELLKGLFIIGDDMTSEILSDLINNKITEESVLQGLEGANKKDLNKLGKLANKPIKFLAKQSSLVDSFYKIARFEQELATFKKAQAVSKEGDELNGLTLGQLQRLAAEKVLDTSQSFVRTTPAAKAMQNSFLGLAVIPFVRFYMEVPRIMYKTIQVARKEMASKNPVLRQRGIRRISGFATTVGGWGYIVPAILRNLYNITDEEEEVLRESAPNYSQTHTFFYTRVGDKLLSWDLTFVNPFAQMTDGGARFFEFARRGDMEKATELLLRSFIGVPFLQGQISTGAIIEAINDKDSFGNTISKVGAGEMENLGKRILHIFESGYEPPTIQRIRKKMFAAADADREDFLQTPYGMLLAEFLPAKPYEIDPNKVADKIFRKLSAQKAQLSFEKGILKYDRPLSKGQVEDIVASQVDGLMTIADRALHYENGLKALGVSDKYYREKLDKLLTKKDAALLRRTGKIRSPQLSDSISKSIRKVSVKYPDVGDRLRLWKEAMREYGSLLDVKED